MGAAGTDGYSVKFSEVALVIEDMRNARNQIRSALDNFIARLKGSIGPEHWTQGAANVFDAAETAWNNDINHIHDVLVMAENTLDDIVTNYDITDKQAAAMYHKVGL